MVSLSAERLIPFRKKSPVISPMQGIQRIGAAAAGETHFVLTGKNPSLEDIATRLGGTGESFDAAFLVSNDLNARIRQGENVKLQPEVTPYAKGQGKHGERQARDIASFEPELSSLEARLRQSVEPLSFSRRAAAKGLVALPLLVALEAIRESKVVNVGRIYNQARAMEIQYPSISWPSFRKSEAQPVVVADKPDNNVASYQEQVNISQTSVKDAVSADSTIIENPYFPYVTGWRMLVPETVSYQLAPDEAVRFWFAGATGHTGSDQEIIITSEGVQQQSPDRLALPVVEKDGIPNFVLPGVPLENTHLFYQKEKNGEVVEQDAYGPVPMKKYPFIPGQNLNNPNPEAKAFIYTERSTEDPQAEDVFRMSGLDDINGFVASYESLGVTPELDVRQDGEVDYIVFNNQTEDETIKIGAVISEALLQDATFTQKSILSKAYFEASFALNKSFMRAVAGRIANGEAGSLIGPLGEVQKYFSELTYFVANPVPIPRQVERRNKEILAQTDPVLNAIRPSFYISTAFNDGNSNDQKSPFAPTDLIVRNELISTAAEYEEGAASMITVMDLLPKEFVEYLFDLNPGGLLRELAVQENQKKGTLGKFGLALLDLMGTTVGTANLTNFLDKYPELSEGLTKAAELYDPAMALRVPH